MLTQSWITWYCKEGHESYVLCGHAEVEDCYHVCPACQQEAVGESYKDQDVDWHR